MNLSDEEAIAALAGALTKVLQRVVDNSDISVTKLAREFARAIKTPDAPTINIPETVVNIPETNVTNSMDLVPLQAAMDANTKQMAAMTKAILATISKPKTEVDFDITRDAVNGLIKRVSVKPKRETMN